MAARYRISLFSCAAVNRESGMWYSSLTSPQRRISTGVFDHPPFSHRQQHTYNTLPLHDANRFGGRTAYFREIGPFDHKRKGRLFKRDLRTLQYNVDTWCAQSTLRKKWKGRDWEVVELPFNLAPTELQRVIPEQYTDVPQMTQPAVGDYSNIRSKVYDREELQDVLFGGKAHPYPRIVRVKDDNDKASLALNKFL
ncbi:unnamed protein product [Phytomonas sp. EM1]|nr:unnamed protein product [Phytomonas sp. EM1]|eukprot:CCW63559.1 unnamed protein product [Phytomonas sp. isolate EM1]